MKISIIWAWAFWYSWARYISELHTDFDILLYDVNESVISLLKNSWNHPYFFTDYRIKDNVSPSWSIEEVLEDVDLILLALPSHHIWWFMRTMKPLLKKQVHILNASKWLEIGTLKPINQVVSHELESLNYTYAVVSGWMIAADFFYGKPLWAQLGVRSSEDAKYYKEIIESKNLEIQVTEWNINEIELLWSLKNIIAIYAGYLEWLSYPIGTISYELCKVIEKDIPQLLESLWWRAWVHFSDFSYGGDLLTTVFWDSRSKYFWKLLWEGLSLEAAHDRLKSEQKLSEGYVLLAELFKHPNIYTQIHFLNRLHIIS
jgi:glycerol-3-phosphate dehydrogenase (NAD(P)+)